MLISRILDDIAARRRQRRREIPIDSLSEHQLRDIGVSRYDLFTSHSQR
jgi:uncharacterized protein YjiS (DUF1127 family)